MSSNIDRQGRGLLTLANFATKLKRVARTGWLDRGIPPREVESVADHSLGVALLAWACAVQREREGAALDPARVALLALIHDLPEAETGDTPPYDLAALPAGEESEARNAFLNRRHVRDQAAQFAKRANEDAAMLRLMGDLPAAVRSELKSLWDELRQGSSTEARFVKQVDRLETFLQSRAYMDQLPQAPMDSFRREVLETIDDPLLAIIRDAALADNSSV